MSAGERPDSQAGYLATRTFGSLDGLRALSILGVLWHHTTSGWAALPATRRGFLGVDLFFVISGFLITTLLLRERSRTGSISLRGFYFRRSLRIFPPYYAMLALVAVVAFVKPGNNAAGLQRDLPFALVYLSNMVPMSSLLAITWSLSTEEQFYLVVPALHRFLPRVTPWLLIPLAYLVFALPPFGVLPELHLPSVLRETTFGPILLGVMLAHALHTRAGYRWISRLLGHRLASMACLLLVVLACCHPALDISGWPRLFIQWSLTLLVASCVVREDHLLRPVLSWGPLRRLGVVSYGVYLYHLLVYWPVDLVLRRMGWSSEPALFAGVTLGTWAVAELSYRFFESPILALKSRFAPAGAAGAGGPAAAGDPAAAGG